MKRKRLIIEVAGMVDIEKMTVGDILAVGESVGEVVNVRLGEEHFSEPHPIKCPRCGSLETMKYGMRNEIQEYLCSKCKRKFTDRDLPFGMRTPIDQIGASLNMYYSGLSLTDVAQHLKTTYDNPVDRSTIYHWLIKYTQEALELFEPIHPKVGNVWIADETVIKFNDINYWVFDCIDRDTRFLLGSHLSPNRGTQQAKRLMEVCAGRAGKAPKKILTDKLKAYIDGIEIVFGSDTIHIQSSPFSEIDSTNIIERFQATIKERTKVVWGFKTPKSAGLILSGFWIHYNYFRPHLSLDNLTPGEAAHVKAPVKNWTELVRKVGA